MLKSVLTRNVSWTRSMAYESVRGPRNARTLAGVDASASDGRITGLGRLERCPSYAPKKNARSFTNGPPKVPPNWLIWLKGFGRAGVKLGFFAFSDSSRKYSNALPVSLLIPDLVTTLITPPAAL